MGVESFQINLQNMVFIWNQTEWKPTSSSTTEEWVENILLSFIEEMLINERSF